MSNAAEKLTVTPLRRTDFGLSQHRIRQFDATVPGQYTIEDLQDPALWSSVAGQLEMGAEVRCLADDMSFVAHGVCTFAAGAVASIKIYSFYPLDKVDPKLVAVSKEYDIKLRGPKKWCIVHMPTGDVVKEGIANQGVALRELEDYERALRS